MTGLPRAARGNEPGVAPGSPRSVGGNEPSVARRALTVLLVASGSVLLGGCYAPGFHLPQAADAQGSDAARLWQGAQMAAIGVGAIVWALIAFTLIRYRRRSRADPDAIPSQKSENIPIEVTYTVIPLVIVVILFGFTTVTQRRINAVRSDPALKVDVTAYQWGWRFHYPSGNVTVQSEGLSVPQLVLPKGETTEITLTATDVVHAFYVPSFLFQRNAVPGSPTRFDLTPTRTGTFGGRCATFCGIRHTNMLFTVRVVSPDEFTQWLASGPAGGGGSS